MHRAFAQVGSSSGGHISSRRGTHDLQSNGSRRGTHELPQLGGSHRRATHDAQMGGSHRRGTHELPASGLGPHHASAGAGIAAAAGGGTPLDDMEALLLQQELHRDGAAGHRPLEDEADGAGI